MSDFIDFFVRLVDEADKIKTLQNGEQKKQHVLKSIRNVLSDSEYNEIRIGKIIDLICTINKYRRKLEKRCCCF